jgi:DNA mismatch endonuclease (patch repair protein)
LADKFTKPERSKIMAQVKSENTSPELAIRKLLHRLGFRFRLHRKDLPGKPDIVLPKHKTVIFVHGCFWHGHLGCKRASRPTSNTDFWNKKLDRNIERDRAAREELEKIGWRVMTIWECEIKDTEKMEGTMNFLSDATKI